MPSMESYRIELLLRKLLKGMLSRHTEARWSSMSQDCNSTIPPMRSWLQFWGALDGIQCYLKSTRWIPEWPELEMTYNVMSSDWVRVASRYDVLLRFCGQGPNQMHILDCLCLCCAPVNWICDRMQREPRTRLVTLLLLVGWKSSLVAWTAHLFESSQVSKTCPDVWGTCPDVLEPHGGCACYHCCFIIEFIAGRSCSYYPTTWCCCRSRCRCGYGPTDTPPWSSKFLFL